MSFYDYSDLFMMKNAVKAAGLIPERADLMVRPLFFRLRRVFRRARRPPIGKPQKIANFATRKTAFRKGGTAYEKRTWQTTTY